MTLTIDAMDFLYTANYDGFAIVSSDSDFTPLAIKLKEAELRNLLKTAWKSWQNDEGYVNVSSAGAYIKRVKPNFDISEFGYSKLPEYLRAFPSMYEVIEYKGKGTVKIIAFKLRQN